MRWWKWLGLAGLIGAAAVGTGAIVHQRRVREIRDYDGDELRDRLHDRLARANGGADGRHAAVAGTSDRP